MRCPKCNDADFIAYHKNNEKVRYTCLKCEYEQDGGDEHGRYTDEEKS